MTGWAGYDAEVLAAEQRNEEWQAKMDREIRFWNRVLIVGGAAIVATTALNVLVILGVFG